MNYSLEIYSQNPHLLMFRENNIGFASSDIDIEFKDGCVLKHYYASGYQAITAAIHPLEIPEIDTDLYLNGDMIVVGRGMGSYIYTSDGWRRLCE
jgi:hypothetical protein